MHSFLSIVLGAALLPASFQSGGPLSDFAGPVRLVLPETIYATPGIETNLYFENVLLTLTPGAYFYDVTCPKGTLLEARWTFSPKGEEAGAYPLMLEVRDSSNSVVARGRSTVRVASAGAGSGSTVRLLTVGDSLTQPALYQRHIHDLCAAGKSPSLRLIGTRGPDDLPATGEIRHEGIGGWTAQAFATLYGPNSWNGYPKGEGTGSPFVYPDASGRPKLDFARYCREFNQGMPPDFVTFGLGTNDVWRATDEDIDRVLDGILGYFDTLIGAVHAFRPEIRVGILLPPPPSPSQDGFRGYTGGQKQTAWQYRRNYHRLIERLISHFGGRGAENIWLVPVYLGFDTRHNYHRRSFPVHGRDGTEVTQVIDPVHPASSGHQQIGDVIYSWIKVCLAHSGRR
ncbi:MAG: SGNH/GDSL hydrolase family protein [Acidobacteriota bacterium]